MVERDLANRTILITGATAGIGRVTATQLARRGAYMLLVGRNAERGQQAAQEISALSLGGNVAFLPADISSLDSIRHLSEVVSQQFPQVDTLINNVAGLYPTKQETVDGLESTLVVTHLGPFLLTRLLLPLLLNKPAGRIVNVSSGTYSNGHIDPETLQAPGAYQGFAAYMSAKLAVVLTTLELARRTKDSSLLAIIADPGGANTGNLSASMQPGMMDRRMRAFTTIFAFLVSLPGNEQRAARSSIHAATAPGLQSGLYLKANTRPARIDQVAQDRELARRVWHTSNQLVGLPDEIILQILR
jgi:retinol dehydrogenase-14